MRIYNPETKAIISEGEFVSLYPQTSFPFPLTKEIIESFGYREIVDLPPPVYDKSTQYIKQDGIEENDGQYIVKYSLCDYTQQELASKINYWRQSVRCTPFQGRMALSEAGLLNKVQAVVDAANASDEMKIAWEYAVEWRRASPMISALAQALKISDEQVDELFNRAMKFSA